MARVKRSTRRKPRSNPRGVLDVRLGGYGFVKTAEGEFFIPQSKMNGAFHGDLVELAPMSNADRGGGKSRRSAQSGSVKLGDDRPAARVLRVIDRAHDTVLGRYEVAEPFGVVVPEDPRLTHDIFTMRADYPDVPDGALVRVRLTTYPDRHQAATGIIEEVLGQAGDMNVLIDTIIGRHKLETVFSDASLDQARRAQLDEEGALAEGYRDIRDRFIWTIDPIDARDFDDAVSLERMNITQVPDGASKDAARYRGAVWRLGVHIADVSHYVPWGSSIDLDARRRATSVYLADRVIPMLPEELSDDLCSLRPDVTRRSMTIDLYLSDQAEILSVDAYPALIRSRARLHYGEVQEILEAAWAQGQGSSSDLSTAPALDISRGQEAFDNALRDRLVQLSRIARLRDARRRNNGGIEFTTVEAKVVLDEGGHPTDIVLRKKTDATQLIEEAMIMANEAVAQYLSQRGIPAIYRVHEQPTADALEGLLPILQEFLWFRQVDQAGLLAGDPRAIQDILSLSADRPEAELVSSLVLRSMQRAVYRPSCDGHYGLASPAYAHFTSPIRRYPDLVVHRMLRAALTGPDASYGEQVAALGWIAEHSSAMERVADEAARESQECKIIEYLQDRIGQCFHAVIAGVASYGVFVRLDNTAEGILPLRDLGNEYFMLDPARYSLTGTDSGKTYRLGQKIQVVLTEADPRSRSLKFRKK